MTPSFEPRIDVALTLAPSTLESINQLVARATETDGVHPLSDHVTFALHHGASDHARHFTAWHNDALAGYAYLDRSDGTDGSSAELVVDPGLRRRGIGTALLTTLRQHALEGRLRIWAHGDSVAAAALAAEQGFTRSRTLRQLRRPLTAPLPPPRIADGITVRTFRPGVDDAAWLAVNAAAFADHPEQGAWTQADLAHRLSASWFDAEGFFIAERIDTADAAQMVGFHWTKVHAADDPADALGEIYVIAVLPEAAGQGLGRALATIGLEHLRQRGLREALLYVEATNVEALRLYESLGFSVWETDVMYAAPARPRLVPRSIDP
jgi:mycothiol synthase